MIITDETGAQRMVGYVIDTGSEPDVALCWLDLGPEHMNRSGVLHGGVMTVLLDTASGAACSARIDPETLPPVLTLGLNVQFLAPARSGRVTARARVVRGRRHFFTQAELCDETGQILATASGIFLKPKQETL